MLLRSLRVELIWLMHTGSPDHRIWLLWPSSCSSSSSLKPGTVQAAWYWLWFTFYSFSILRRVLLHSKDFKIRWNVICGTVRLILSTQNIQISIIRICSFQPPSNTFKPVTQTSVLAALMFWRWGVWCSVNHIKGFAPRGKLTQPGRKQTEEGNRTSVTGISPVHSLIAPLGSACLLWAHRACNCIY